MLIDLVEHEIFYLEGTVKAFNSKQSKKSLSELQSILKILGKSGSQIDNSLNKEQREIMFNLVKQAQLSAQRVLNEHKRIKEIQQNSNTLNKLEKALYVT